MKTSTKILCILGLVASSVGVTIFTSWKEEFFLEYPIPEELDLTYGDIYALNLINHYYQDNPQANPKFTKKEKCYLKRLKEKGYISDKNHIINPTLLENIPEQTRYVGGVFEYGSFVIDPRSFMYPWSEDLTKRGFYTSAYYLDGLPMQKVYYRTFKAKFVSLVFDVC